MKISLLTRLLRLFSNNSAPRKPSRSSACVAARSSRKNSQKGREVAVASSRIVAGKKRDTKILECGFSLTPRVTFLKPAPASKSPRQNSERSLWPLCSGLTRLMLVALVFAVTALRAEEPSVSQASSAQSTDSSKIFYPNAAQPKAVAPVAAAHPIMASIVYLAFLGGLGFVVYGMWNRKNCPVGGRKIAPSALEITATKPLGNRQFLVVVKHNSEEILLGVGQGFITRLSGCENSKNEISGNSKSFSAVPSSKNFSDVLINQKETV